MRPSQAACVVSFKAIAFTDRRTEVAGQFKRAIGINLRGDRTRATS